LVTLEYLGKFNSRKIERSSVKKSIKTVWLSEGGIEICFEPKEMAELVPMKLKKKAGKCTVIEKEGVSKTNNALLKAVVKAHLWKCQLEEGKHASVREFSTKINIRDVQSGLYG
jgi:site-specific DNA recombinase